MKINFDSNVWRIVANPDAAEYATEPSLNDFKKIKAEIIDGKIEPFLTETMFTLEAIKKKDRKDFFTGYKPKIEFKESITDDGRINIQFSIGPDTNAHPGNTPQLEQYLQHATALGFKILKFSRIGGLVNNDIEKYLYKMEDRVLTKYLDDSGEIGGKIHAAGAGFAFMENIGLKYDTTNWRNGIKIAPETEVNAIAKAFAEWADGDSVAAHIASGGDYFCTRDGAGGAGSKSIFSAANKAWLSADYGFKTITPEGLAALL